MKLSEITFEMAKGLYMPHDSSDALTKIELPRHLDYVKEQIMPKYGDIEVVIDLNREWFDQVEYVDKHFDEDCRGFDYYKSRWCDKYGCE